MDFSKNFKVSKSVLINDSFNFSLSFLLSLSFLYYMLMCTMYNPENNSLYNNDFSISSLILISSRIFLIKKIVYNNTLKRDVNTVLKGIAGSYTLSSSLKMILNKNKAAFNYHIYNYLKTMYQEGIKNNDCIENQIFFKTNNLLKYNTMFDQKIYKPFTLIDNKFSSYMIPFNQNFLAHNLKKQALDPQKIKLPYNLQINFDEYNNVGMTAQNFIELAGFCEGIHEFVDYANSQNKTYEIIAKNPLKNNTSNLNILHNKHIQKNNDFIMNINFELHSKQIPCDVKLIGNAINKLPLINGNISLVHDYDVVIHLTRLKGVLSMIPNKEKIISELDILINEYKKSKTPIFLLNNKFKILLFDILLDPECIDIFPSLIVKTPVLAANNIFLEDDEIFTKELIHKLTTEEVYPEKFFPSMGFEKHDDYLLYKDQILKLIPSTHLSIFMENFEKLKILC